MTCCKYTSGMLREPVTIQRQTTTAIGGGATEISYTTHATTRGGMTPVSGRELAYASRLDAQTSNRLLLRYRADLLESDRIVIRERAYQIRYIDNVEFRNKWLLLDLDGGTAT